MSMRVDSRRIQGFLPAAMPLLAALSLLIVPGANAGAEETAIRAGTVRTLASSHPIRVILIRGVVEPTEETFLGRPKRVAIVSVTDQGFLVQNSVEDSAAGEQLKDHVGEDVTARGAILVKADGTAVLLVESFEVHGSPDEED